jgi:hypothetical protein
VAEYLGETWTRQGPSRVVLRYVLAIPNPSAGFCSICPSEQHPEVPECVWLTASDPPSMDRFQIDTATLLAEGPGSWRITWEGPAGKLFEGTLSAADGPQNIPTVGSGPKRREDLRGGSARFLGGG